MLELRHLKKTYKTKGNVEVHALDDVSVVFPETGMVFLLGKSGSGKSTLLNVSGGLDRPDEGEIIIKGKNSKDFSASDFDSYRNTFIGFIFQEYNILNEFSVEQNISLALQLQGKKSDKAVVNSYLEQVGLEGLGKRKPNTLSGGQKQRVAIARALIKNPRIIMADEPTGALDSNTGKQVFDTLKKLSKDKLVIIVSHDRDFAEIYADRIIELKDGKIISDVSKEIVETKPATDNVKIVNDHTISITDASSLSEKDIKEIVNALKNQKGEAIISTGEHDLPLVKQAIKVNSDNTSQVFKETKDVKTNEYNGKETKFIRSRLPLGRAIKMGASYLKIKPVKMVFTSILTITSLTMFGVVSTLMLYDEAYSISEALQASSLDYEAIGKEYYYTQHNLEINNNSGSIDGDYTYDSSSRTPFGVKEIEEINKNNVNHKFAGVYTFGTGHYSTDSVLTFSGYISSETYYRQGSIYGFIEDGESYMESIGATLNGSYPLNSNEIAISKYMYEAMASSSSLISSMSDVIGQTFDVNLRGNSSNISTSLKVTGIYDVGSIPEKFNALKDNDQSVSTNEIVKLVEELDTYLANSYHRIGYVASSFYDAFAGTLYNPNSSRYFQTVSTTGITYSVNPVSYTPSQEEYSPVYTDRLMEYYKASFSFFDKDGDIISYVAPKDDEIYVSSRLYTNALFNTYYSFISKGNTLLNYYHYNSDAYNYFSDSTNYENYSSALNRYRNYISNNMSYYEEGFSPESDLALIQEKLDLYYPNLATNVYILSKASSLIDAHNFISESSSTEYEEFVSNYNSVSSATPPIAQSYFDDIDSYIASRTSEEKNILSCYELYFYVNNFLYEFSEEDINAAQSVISKYQNSLTMTDSEFTTLSNFFDKYNLIRYSSVDYGYSKSDVDTSTQIGPISLDRIYYRNFRSNDGSLKVIGFFDTGDYPSSDFIVAESFAKSMSVISENTWITYEESDYVKPSDAKYDFAITKTQFSQGQVNNLIKSTSTYRYVMTDSIYQNLMIYINLISILKTVFLIIGIVFGVFAALLLLNFISNSISSKTKEIGILRAVGARGSDLFKIYFAESGILAGICAVLAVIISAVICLVFNNSMIKEIGIAMLNFGLINIAFIIVGAILIAILGTFLPVTIASKKPPVESIRTL